MRKEEAYAFAWIYQQVQHACLRRSKLGVHRQPTVGNKAAFLLHSFRPFVFEEITAEEALGILLGGETA